MGSVTGNTPVVNPSFKAKNTNSKLISWNAKKFDYSTKKDTLFSNDNIMSHIEGYNEEKVIELDKKLSLVEQSQSIMNKEITEIKEDLKSINTKLDSITEKLSDKFAAKWVETAMRRVITAVCWWVLTGVLALVLK